MKNSYFIDTSALFKRYVYEEGSVVLDRIFSQNSGRYISSLTLIEVVSNLRRLVDVDKIISEEEFRLVQGTFLHDIKTGTIDVLDVKAPIILKSLELCSEAYLTPIDAIQLATLLSSDKLIFVCSDKRLLKIAKAKGVETLNPIYE